MNSSEQEWLNTAKVFFEQIQKEIKNISPHSPVKIIAVSKFQSLEKIRSLYQELGICDFGENYLQELEEKKAALADLPLNWHFIGALQSKKLKKLLPGSSAAVNLIHSISQPKHLELLDSAAQKNNFLLQINLFAESQKQGFDFNPEQIEANLQRLKPETLKYFKGFMSMGPSENPDSGYELLLMKFQELAKFFAEMKIKYPQLETLSLGMSQDYKLALKAGSNCLRIGSAFFGARAPK